MIVKLMSDELLYLNIPAFNYARQQELL